jgi:hypothetical protein
MFNFFKLVTPVSVDSIVADFTKVAGQLEALIQTKVSLIENNNKVIDLLSDDNALHDQEISRAETIKKNINKLLSV